MNKVPIAKTQEEATLKVRAFANYLRDSLGASEVRFFECVPFEHTATFDDGSEAIIGTWGYDITTGDTFNTRLLEHLRIAAGAITIEDIDITPWNNKVAHWSFTLMAVVPPLEDQ